MIEKLENQEFTSKKDMIFNRFDESASDAACYPGSGILKSD